jgi:hypothetical protein
MDIISGFPSSPEDATGQMLIGYTEGNGGYATHCGKTFPAAGYRHALVAEGQANDGRVFYRAYYQSCSAITIGIAYAFTFFDGSVSMVNSSSNGANRFYARPVRCLLDQ